MSSLQASAAIVTSITSNNDASLLNDTTKMYDEYNNSTTNNNSGNIAWQSSFYDDDDLENNDGDDDGDIRLEQVNEEIAPTVSPQQVDEMLAKEMTSLSMKDRDDALYDIHGVSDVAQETADFLKFKLQDLRHELQFVKFPKSNDGTPIRKDKICSDGDDDDDDDDFLLMFLRANQYNTKTTAKHVALHYQKKLELFGRECLDREITFEDLNLDDQEALQSAMFQLLPSRDRAGRAVVFVAPGLGKYKTVQNMMRAFWYFNMCLIRSDIDTQKKGLAVIFYFCQDDSTSSMFGTKLIELIPKIGNLEKGLPTRPNGLHFCYNTYSLRPVMALVHVCSGKVLRSRMRSHYGTPMEIIYNLMTFGIDRDSLPFEHNDTRGHDATTHQPILMRRNHLEWIQTQQNIEKELKRRSLQRQNQQVRQSNAPIATFSASSDDVVDDAATNDKNNNDVVPTNIPSADLSSPLSVEVNSKTTLVDPIPTSTSSSSSVSSPTIVTLPGKYDVLFGKGKSIQSHPGNIRFHNLIDSYQNKYESVGKFEKTTIAETIVSVICLNNQGQFLKWNSKQEYWEVASRAVARDKVSHAFRTRRNSLARRNNNNKIHDNGDCISKKQGQRRRRSFESWDDGNEQQICPKRR